MSNNKQQTAVDWYIDELYKLNVKFLNSRYGNQMTTVEYSDCKEQIKNQAKEKDKEQQEKLSASWAKSREQTRETAMHVGFAKGFMSGLECYEDYYSELENTDLDEDEFTRNYITDRFEERY
jgi:hypothetical protein